MKILARGEKIRTEELKQKLSGVECDLMITDSLDLPVDLPDYDIIFDLAFDEYKDQLKFYAALPVPVIVSSAKIQLTQVAREYGAPLSCRLIGLNALPGFINRSLAEISLLKQEDKKTLDLVMQQLKWDYKVVDDRVGMVTPRIIFMIINEACYTVQEGTASMKDIDTSMKLGTNYPHGPFEWSDKIGIRHVYETLAAVYEDTKDERYKICPLLKTFYLKGDSFYNN